MNMSWMGRLSRVNELPLLGRISPREDGIASAEDREGYGRCQGLAREAVREVASLVREGWTERQGADLLGTYLRDHGVRSFFHHPFAWYGERTRFSGIRSYRAFQPGERRIAPGEVFILDVAPILDGYTCDIGYTSSLGPNGDLEKTRAWLREIREEIPALFLTAKGGGEVWRIVDEKVKRAGYDNIHRKYPFGVLGHRVPRVSGRGPALKALHFGWQSYWGLASRGLFGQLLAEFHEGALSGLWAVEPHIGGKGFGAKFEEILVVDDQGARWLQEAFV